MSKTQELAERLRDQGGFELYAHAYERPDLNDFRGGYTRAARNLKMNGDGTIKENIISNKIGDIAPFWDFDVVGYQEKVPNKVYKHVPKLVRVKRSFFSGGLFGLTEEVDQGREQYVQVGNRKVSEVINLNDQKEAGYLHFGIRANVLDKSGRSGGMPALGVVCNSGLVGETVDYLANNPGEQYHLIGSILRDCPNVTKNILGIAKPAKNLILLDMARFDEGRFPRDNGVLPLAAFKDLRRIAR